jgi:predicted transcriptional regulator
MGKLKKHRRMVGLTQHDVARLTGIPFGRLVYAETGRIRLTCEEIERIRGVITSRAAEIAVIAQPQELAAAAR